VGTPQAASFKFQKAAKSFNSGTEALNASLLAYAKNQIEETVSATQKLLNCRSLEDAAQVQTQYMQQSFDRLVKEASKLAQSSANMAKNTASPIKDQIENFVQKMTRTAA
jgi:phasin family protein